jgi:hypothetical protein
VAAAAVLVCAAPAARAYDPATTHAGLTERAALSSSLHKVLSRRLGRALGLLEPLQLHSRLMDAPTRRALWDRLSALDPAGGYRPSNDGAATALSWLVAGAVLAETPPERGRHHFLEPPRLAGLHDSAGLTGLAYSLRLIPDGGATVRQLAAGTAFDLTGKSSLAWLEAPENDQSVPVFLAAVERAVAAGEPAEREAALVHGLLALGGILAVLQDAGEPAHVRNDFREAFLHRRSASAWDEASAYERFVARRYGRIGVPAPGAAVKRPSFEAFFSASDGQGLADRTHRRFFSAGTLPADVPVEPTSTPHDVVRSVRESLAYPQPGVAALDLRKSGQRQYLWIAGRRTLGYVREPRQVRFFLDEAIHVDTSRVLLPEVAAYTAGLLDHLLRASIKTEASGRQVTLTLEGAAAQGGKLRVFAEDARGVRTELQASADASVTIEAPAGTRRIAAVMRGADAAGPFVAAGEVLVE